MNLRPSGYEPDELPGCSTPRWWKGAAAAGGVMAAGAAAGARRAADRRRSGEIDRGPGGGRESLAATCSSASS